MNRIRFAITLWATVVLGQACSGDAGGGGRELTRGEAEAAVCLNEWFSARGVDQLKLRRSMEGYFAAGGITKSSDALAKQYQDILVFMARPSKPFPAFADKKEIVQMTERLELTSSDIRGKKQLRCLLDAFRKHSDASDSTSAFYAWGDILSTMEEVPNVSPGLVASALPPYMTEKDFGEPLYQTAIALMFYLDFTLYLND